MTVRNRLERERRGRRSGAHSPVVRVVFYVVGGVMVAVEVAALLDMPLIGGAPGSGFDGWSRDQRFWQVLLGDRLIVLWLAVSTVLALGVACALWAVRRAGGREARPVGTTLLNAVGWRGVYRRRLIITDLVVILWAMVGAQVLWLGPGGSQLGILHGRTVPYGWVGLAIGGIWALALQMAGARDPLVYGEGSAEYGRVASGSLTWFGILAILAVLLKADFARGYVLISFPLGTLALLFGRSVWRQWLVIKRGQGLYCARSVVVGDADAVRTVVEELSRPGASGYSIQAIALSDPAGEEDLADLGVPIVAMSEAINSMRGTISDSVIVAGGKGVSADALRSLSWRLDPTESLILTPMLLDVAGPRVATRPVAGLNLVHVEMPRFTGPKAALKRGMDVVFAGVGLAILAIPFAVIAVVIKVSSPGPVFYRQERVGLGGSPFRMWKFRSMVPGADRQIDELAELRAAQRAGPDSGVGNEVLFKLKDDPRVTRVGQWMRKVSIDELPQLINVVGGSMSLVGPRPPLRREVEQYTPDQVARRFLVKPGITGLWQVSGRSDLNWEESIRLDLYYVENWSVSGDLQLLLRTIGVVLKGEGAY
ncbi:MAG: sugar transferase [Bifidobacteriaceae bacterium]|jgi:exopolysaccharide biosynthesis polyprenyl glycosylphosphotransferase|nr:sugar transferase [Bifidobacteriaceae bacterium]